MVASLNRNVPAREIGYNVMQYVSARVTALASGAVVTAEMGLPIGAVIMWVHSKVITAITGGTPVLSVGSFGDSGLDDIVAVLAETAGSELAQPIAAFVQPLAADTRVFASIAGGATAGDAIITIGYIKPVG